MARKIVVNATVRALLAELDETMDKFHEHTAQLAKPGLNDSDAVNIGAEREQVRGIIVGIAWRLNKASTGRAE